jgi:chemotaxis protein CheD
MTLSVPVSSAPNGGRLPAGTELLVAGIGEMVLTTDPAVGLIAYGLGSCVALSIWDGRTKVAALAHFMLPAGAIGGAGATGGAAVKFVDTGLPVLLGAFEARGGTVRGAQFKAAGGAAMLAINASAMEIGRRNAEAVVSALAARGLRLAANDFGGKSGRTVQLEVPNGRLHVRSVSQTSVL